MQMARCLWVTLLLILVVSSLGRSHVEVAANKEFMGDRQACTRQASRWSCILGCFKCAETYGRKVKPFCFINSGKQMNSESAIRNMSYVGVWRYGYLYIFTGL